MQNIIIAASFQLTVSIAGMIIIHIEIRLVLRLWCVVAEPKIHLGDAAAQFCEPFRQTLSACQFLVSARIEYSPYILGPPSLPQVSSKLYVLPQITNFPTPAPTSDNIARLH